LSVELAKISDDTSDGDKVSSTISSENNDQNRAQKRVFGRSDDMDDIIRHSVAGPEVDGLDDN
jgi:hypothetical protein